MSDIFYNDSRVRRLASEYRYPRVGVGVVCYQPGKGVPFMLRKGSSHGNGEWTLPGGRLEMFESLQDCADRELLEEFGVTGNLEPIEYVSEDFFRDEGMHWITHYFFTLIDKPPSIMEPHKCERIEFFDRVVPSPIMIGAAGAIDWLTRNNRLCPW